MQSHPQSLLRHRHCQQDLDVSGISPLVVVSLGEFDSCTVLFVASAFAELLCGYSAREYAFGIATSVYDYRVYPEQVGEHTANILVRRRYLPG
jgi:hypothetical protein